MDFECEVLCWRNAERRRYAEKQDLKVRREAAAARREQELKKWRRWGRNVKIAGQVHLGVSTVLALLGLPVWAAMGVFGAVFYYLCAWEFRMLEGRYGG